jgi:hypothetical protein
MSNEVGRVKSRRDVSNRSTHSIAVQPSFSTIRCKVLNILSKACYSVSCLLTLILEISSSVNDGNTGRRWLVRVLLPSI